MVIAISPAQALFMSNRIATMRAVNRGGMFVCVNRSSGDDRISVYSSHLNTAMSSTNSLSFSRAFTLIPNRFWCLRWLL